MERFNFQHFYFCGFLQVGKPDIINLTYSFITLCVPYALLIIIEFFKSLKFDLKYILSKTFFQRNVLVLQRLYIHIP